MHNLSHVCKAAELHPQTVPMASSAYGCFITVKEPCPGRIWPWADLPFHRPVKTHKARVPQNTLGALGAVAGPSRMRPHGAWGSGSPPVQGGQWASHPGAEGVTLRCSQSPLPTWKVMEGQKPERPQEVHPHPAHTATPLHRLFRDGTQVA